MTAQTDAPRSVSLGFSGHRVAAGQHVCLIYNDDKERNQVMARYVESGLLDNELVLYFVDSMTPADMAQELREKGVKAEHLAGRLELASAMQAYTPDGEFDPDAMCHKLRSQSRLAEREGFSGLRVTGEATWCLRRSRTDLKALMVYEAQVTDLARQEQCTLCCQYDARLFDGQTIMDVLAVHPLAIVRGQLVHNPFYVPPHEFLSQLDMGYSDSYV